MGQKGRLTEVWAQKGSRPTAVKRTKYGWVYLYAAVDPATGASRALLAPHVDTQTLNLFLQRFADDLKANDPLDHAVLVMDRAGGHTSRGVAVPDNVTILLLPPYAPELNPVERLWLYLREQYLSNRAFADYNALLEANTAAWQQLTPGLLRSICRCEYLNDDAIRRAK